MSVQHNIFSTLGAFFFSLLPHQASSLSPGGGVDIELPYYHTVDFAAGDLSRVPSAGSPSYTTAELGDRVSVGPYVPPNRGYQQHVLIDYFGRIKPVQLTFVIHRIPTPVELTTKPTTLTSRPAE